MPRYNLIPEFNSREGENFGPEIFSKLPTILFGPYEFFSEQVRIIGGSGHGVQSKGGLPKIGNFRPKSIKIDIKSGFQGRKLIFCTKEGFEM